MIQLAYISVQTKPLPKEVIKDILDKSITNNSQKNITGMLIFYNGTFLQVLEGPDNKVMDLYHSLKLDKRHQNLDILYKKDIQSTAFSSWSMGFVDVEEISKKGDKDFISFFNQLKWDKDDENKITENNISKVKLIIDKFQRGAWRNYIQ